MKKYAATGDANYAAREAGYSSPAKRASQALARPAIVDAIRQEQMARLHNEGVPLAISTLFEVASDKKAPASARVTASDKILSRAGFGASEDGQVKEPWQMTPAELQQAEQVLRRRLVELSGPVIEHEPEPSEPGIFD